MDSLEYSQEALEVKSLFFNKNFTVYVEGEDDVIFWENIFNNCNKEVYVEALEGLNEVEKKIKLIVEKDADFYVAIDNDYREFNNKVIVHKRVITTIGHSIENTLYNTHTIQRVIRQFSRKTQNIATELIELIKDFENTVYPLLIFEIANEKYKKNISILGKNCSRFLKNNSSVHLCADKIAGFIRGLEPQFSKEELKESQKVIDESIKKVWYIIRGHFLTNFIINLIKYFAKKIANKNISLSTDNIFPLFADYVDKADDYPILKEKVHQLFVA